MDPSELGRRLFRAYYRRLRPEEVIVTDVARREFAFTYFGGGGMQRHLAFASLRELLSHMARNVPRHAYYSSAYYRDPSARDMEDKGWLGADLVFDIDVDHVETPCKELHDRWRCRSCGASGWGAAEACPKCGSENLEREVWVCETCINVARDEALKLVDFLESDFGLSPDEMFVTFSGHRGFHVHVESDAVRELSQDGRREIADYVRGLGLDLKFMLVKARGRRYRLRHGGAAPGWYGRLARWALLEAGSDDPELGLKAWRALLDKCVRGEAAAIDERVTIDVRRLIRLPNSLHGKTGLRVVPLKVHELESVDVLERAKVFTRGEALVELEDPPRRALDMELKPGRARLPLYAALYLLLNGARLARFELA